MTTVRAGLDVHDREREHFLAVAGRLFRRQDGSWVTEEHFRDQILLPAAHMPLDEMTQSLMEGSLRLNNMGPWEDDVSLLVVDF